MASPPDRYATAAAPTRALGASSNRAATSPLYGVLRIGTACVALELSALREVVPCPARFESLPAAACGLLGALKLRGRVVPVVDLRPVLGLPLATLAEPVVALIRHEGRMLGLLSDSVHGIACPKDADLHAIDVPGGGGLLFSASFERAEDGSVVSVIDPAAVLRLPGLPTLRDRDGAAAVADVQAGARVPMMLVRCGGIGLAIDVRDVHTALSHVDVQPSCLGMGTTLCPGLIDFRDVEVPAFDPLVLLGLGELPSGQRCQALVLRLSKGFAAVLVNEVIDIVQVAAGDRMPLSGVASPRLAFLDALLRPQGHREYLVLAAGALASDPEVQALSTMNVRRKSASAAAQDIAVLKGRSVISFDLGSRAATALLQVREIVRWTDERIATHHGHPAVIGVCSHRHQAVTLVCLARLLGGEARHGADSRVLLTEVALGPGQASQVFGFVVPRLCGIETARWEQPGVPTLDPGASRTLSDFPLIEVGAGRERRTLPLVDLQALARALLLGEPGDLAPAVDAPAREPVATAG